MPHSVGGGEEKRSWNGSSLSWKVGAKFWKELTAEEEEEEEEERSYSSICVKRHQKIGAFARVYLCMAQPD